MLALGAPAALAESPAPVDSELQPAIVPAEELPASLQAVLTGFSGATPVASLDRPVADPIAAFQAVRTAANPFEAAHLEAVTEVDGWYIVAEEPIPGRPSFAWGYAIKKGETDVYTFNTW
jgi:hypothetical protein